jgi:hypothetical protein
MECSLDRRFDELEPLGAFALFARRWQRDDLPPPLATDDREDRLSAWTAVMARGPRVLWIGGHDPLLDGEDEVVRCVDRRRRDWRIAAAEADLQRADRLPEAKRRLGFLRQAQDLDVVQQQV